MSNKKSTVALYKKRKSFKNIFFKYWLVILVILALIFALGLTIFAENAKNHIRNCFYDVKNNTVNFITSHIAEYEDSAKINSLSFRFCSNFHSRGIPSLLYDKHTGEIVAGCEEQIFLIRRLGESDVEIYAYPTSEIPGWTAHYENLENYCNLLNYTGEDMDIPYFYTDGTNFIPGTFTAHAYSYRRFDYDADKNPLFITNFDAPADIPEGYEKYAYSLDECFPAIACGYHKNSPHFHPLYKVDATAGYNFLMNTYESSVLSEAVSSPDSVKEGIFTLSMSACTEFVTDTNRNLVLINAIDYSVLDVYKTPLIFIAIVIILISLVLSFLLSRVSYARLKAGYDIEDYRKTLMNTMAHDLKSPLMSISGYAENLLNNVHSEKREHYSTAIVDNVNHMNQIIESVLTLSKTENNISLTKENVYASDLINDCLKKYELQISEKKLSFEATGNTPLNVDRVLFCEALDNLMGNAVKYATPDSTICITLDEMHIAFENHCTDSLDVDISTLCQPFVMGNTSRSNQSDNGLGLAIAKNICDLHGFTLNLNYENNCFNATIQVSKGK